METAKGKQRGCIELRMDRWKEEEKINFDRGWEMVIDVLLDVWNLESFRSELM